MILFYNDERIESLKEGDAFFMVTYGRVTEEKIYSIFKNKLNSEGYTIQKVLIIEDNWVTKEHMSVKNYHHSAYFYTEKEAIQYAIDWRKNEIKEKKELINREIENIESHARKILEFENQLN